MYGPIADRGLSTDEEGRGIIGNFGLSDGMVERFSRPEGSLFYIRIRFRKPEFAFRFARFCSGQMPTISRSV